MWCFMVTAEFSVVNYARGNECLNTTDRTDLDDICLFSNITLNCTPTINGSLDNIEWILYPHNTSINTSSVTLINDTSSISFSSTQENVFFLVMQNGDPTNCALCNISLDISQSTSALVDAAQSYCKYNCL